MIPDRHISDAFFCLVAALRIKGGITDADALQFLMLAREHLAAVIVEPQPVVAMLDRGEDVYALTCEDDEMEEWLP